MNISVLIKQQVKDKAGVEGTSALNREFLTVSDLYALELAGRIKDSCPEAKIIGISFCPAESSEDSIRQGLTKALSMVCDKAYMICDLAFEGADAFAQSRIFSRAVSIIEKTEGKMDILLDGEQEQDGSIGVIGSMAAEFLGIPSVSSVLRAEVEEIGSRESFINVKIKKRAEDETWKISANVPLLLTVATGDEDVRYPTFKRIRWANTQEITTLTRKTLFDNGEDFFTGEGAATIPFRTFASSRVGEFVRIEEEDPAEAARTLIRRLRDRILTELI